MTTKVVSCRQGDKLLDVLQQMTRYRLRRLPVLKDKEIIGELTLNQLIRKYYSATQYHSITENEEG